MRVQGQSACVLGCWGSRQSPLPTRRLLCVLTEAGRAPLGSFTKVPLWELHLWVPFENSPSKAPPPNTITLGVRISTYEYVVVQSRSCVWLFAAPWTRAHQAPLSMGFSRQEYWSGLPFPSPGESSWPRDGTCVSCIAGGFSTTEPPGKPIWIRLGKDGVGGHRHSVHNSRGQQETKRERGSNSREGRNVLMVRTVWRWMAGGCRPPKVGRTQVEAGWHPAGLPSRGPQMGGQA